MIGLPVRLSKGRDFLVRSLSQTSGQDLHRSVMVSHQNKVVSGIILRFFRRLNRDASGLSAVEWSPFRTIQSRLIRLMVGPLSSNVFCSKKRALVTCGPMVKYCTLSSGSVSIISTPRARAAFGYFLPNQTRWGPASSDTSTVLKVDFIKAASGNRRCVTSISDPPVSR